MADNDLPETFSQSFSGVTPKEELADSFSQRMIARPTDPGVAGYHAEVEAARPAAREAVLAEPAWRRWAGQIRVPIVSGMTEPLTAAVFAAMGEGQGDTFEQRRRNILAAHQAKLEERAKLSPWGKVAGETVGSVATLPLSLETGIARGVSEGLSTAAKTARPAIQSFVDKSKGLIGSTVESGAFGALGSAAEVKPGETVGESAERIGKGTLIGAAIPSAISGVSSAGGYLGTKITNPWLALWNPEKAAAQKIVEGSKTAPTAKRPGMTVDEYAAAVDQGMPVRPIDIHGVGKQVSEAAGAFPTDPRFQEVKDFLSDRMRDQIGRVHASVDSAFGKTIDPIQRRAVSDQMARAENGPAYAKAYASPGANNVWDSNISAVLNTAEGKQAVEWANNEAMKWAATHRMPGPKSPFLHGPDGKPVLDQYGGLQFAPGEKGPALDFLDLVKRGISQIGREQEGQVAASTRGLADSFATDLKKRFPLYEQAVSGAGKYIKGNNAFDAGYNFMDLATQGRGPAARDFNRQWQLFESNKFTPAERETFTDAIGAWIKENPDQAATLFRSGDKVFMDKISKAIGSDKFNQIGNTLTVNRIMAMNKAIEAQQGKMKEIFGSADLPIKLGAAGIGLSQAAQNIPQLAQMLQTPQGMIAAPFIATQALASSIGGSRRMNALLDMAISDDPKVHQMLLDMASKQKSTQYALSELENRLANVLASRVGQRSEQERAVKGRIPRKSGGRVTTSDNLVAMAERAKKNINNDTQNLLKTHDTQVAQALEIANRNLEG